MDLVEKCFPTRWLHGAGTAAAVAVETMGVASSWCDGCWLVVAVPAVITKKEPVRTRTKIGERIFVLIPTLAQNLR